MDSSACERFVLELVRRMRSKDPNIEGMGLWLIYRNGFGVSQAFVGRDCFCVILSKYKLTICKRFWAPYATDSPHYLPQYPDLTRILLLEYPDQLWISDIVYIIMWLPDGSCVPCYLSPVTDTYMKEIIGYCAGNTLGSCYAVEALEMITRRIAAKEIKDLTHRSDRGVQYASADYIAILRHNGILPSMTRDGNPRDNAIAECVNDIIKDESLQGMHFSSIQGIGRAVATAVHFYNNERPHMSLNMFTPVQTGETREFIRKRWMSCREKYLNAAFA